MVGLAVLAASCSGDGAAKPFHPEASSAGFTVLYSKTDPNHSDPAGGPCAGIAPTAALSDAERGIGGFECTTDPGLDVQLTDLGRGEVALWGLLNDGISRVRVGPVRAVTKGHTYLAVMARPVGKLEVQGLDPAGKVVDTRSSTQLPPPVPVTNASA